MTASVDRPSCLFFWQVILFGSQDFSYAMLCVSIVDLLRVQIHPILNAKDELLQNGETLIFHILYENVHLVSSLYVKLFNIDIFKR